MNILVLHINEFMCAWRQQSFIDSVVARALFIVMYIVGAYIQMIYEVMNFSYAIISIQYVVEYIILIIIAYC